MPDIYSSPVGSALKVLETQIGFPPHQLKGINETPQTISQSQRGLITQWCILQGISRKTISKSSNQTLAKLYQIERYFQSVKRNEDDSGPSLSSINLDDEPKPTVSPISNYNPSPDYSNSDTTIENAFIRINTLQHRLNKHDEEFLQILPRHRQLREEIITAVQNKFQDELKIQDEKLDTNFKAKTSLFEAKVARLASDVAQEIVNKSLPRVLHIKTKENEIVLPAEPRHKIFDKALTWLSSGEHLYLVGPAGTGKTHLGKQLAQALNLSFLPMPQALTKYELSGYLDGNGIYRGTIFREAVEHGGLLVMDEIDINGASAVAFANSVMANGYCAFPDKTIEAHPNLKIVACANTFGKGATQEYVGRNPLDAATLDRFAYLICDYDEDMERQIYGATPWLTYVHRVRNAVQNLKLKHIISMRSIARGQRGLDAGLELSDILFSSLWRGLEPDTINKIENLAGKFQITKPEEINISYETTPNIDEFFTPINSLVEA